MLIEAITRAPDQPEAAHRLLCGMLCVRTCLGALSSAQAVAASFADLGAAAPTGRAGLRLMQSR